MIKYENDDNDDNDDDYGIDISLHKLNVNPHRSAVLAKSVRCVRQPIIRIVYICACMCIWIFYFHSAYNYTME